MTNNTKTILPGATPGVTVEITNNVDNLGLEEALGTTTETRSLRVGNCNTYLRLNHVERRYVHNLLGSLINRTIDNTDAKHTLELNLTGSQWHLIGDYFNFLDDEGGADVGDGAAQIKTVWMKTFQQIGLKDAGLLRRIHGDDLRLEAVGLVAMHGKYRYIQG